MQCHISLDVLEIQEQLMYRVSEAVARKIVKNIRGPEIGPLDITQKDPFTPKNFNSIGLIDPYCCIGTDFHYLLEFPYPFINVNLPPIPCLDGFWLYRREELFPPIEHFSVPRYLADPNILDPEDQLDVTDCSIVTPSEVEKLTCRSIMTFEQLIKFEPLILDCLNREIK
jgi:hypothetical protein